MLPCWRRRPRRVSGGRGGPGRVTGCRPPQCPRTAWWWQLASVLEHVNDDVLDLRLREPGVDRHGDHSSRQRDEECVCPVVSIDDAEGDAFTVVDAHRREPAGHATAAVPHFWNVSRSPPSPTSASPPGKASTDARNLWINEFCRSESRSNAIAGPSNAGRVGRRGKVGGVGVVGDVVSPRMLCAAVRRL